MIQYIPLKRLKHYQRNPRKISAEAMIKLCDNMTRDPEFMERRPVLCYLDEDKINYVVYAGNQRVRAAKKLNWDEIACIVDEYPDAEVIRKRIIIDNRSAGEWDYDILSADYDAQELFDLGFDESDLFGKDKEEKSTTPPKLKMSITFSDQEEMDKYSYIIEELCEKHNLKYSIGK